MKNLLIPFLFLSFIAFAQVEKPPVYKGCENESIQNLETCLNNNLKKDILNEFRVPEIVKSDNYKGQLKIVFLITKTGEFEVLYINSMYKEFEAEVNRVFKLLPKIQPGTYNGRAIDTRYTIPLSIPLSENSLIDNNLQTTEQVSIEDEIQKTTTKNASLFPEFNSELNIPLTHQKYDEIEYYLNVGENTHTASKPYLFNEVKSYVDLEAKRTAILKDKTSWGGRKLFNEHLALVKGKNYWFTLNPVWDLQIGKDNSDVDYTYNNTRGVQMKW